MKRDDPNYDFYSEMAEGQEEIKYYYLQGRKMKLEEKCTMLIDYEHLNSFHTTEENEDLGDDIVANYYRFEGNLNQALHKYMLKYFPDYAKNKTFFLGFYNLSNTYKLREMRTNFIGRLVSIYGTVTRSTEVRPELLKGTFRCTDTNRVYKEIEQQFRLTYPTIGTARGNTNASKYELMIENSIFTDWQKVRIQEQSGDIPAGSMPRSIDVILRGENVDSAKPGDRCIFTGTLIVVPDVVCLVKPGEKNMQIALKNDDVKRSQQNNGTDGISGLKELGVRDMSYKLVFLANSVHSYDTKTGFMNIKDIYGEDQEDASKHMTRGEKEIVTRMQNEEDLYNKLAKSIAPSVFGHEEVKKGILLMLFGGVHKTTQEGMKLRGDINL